MSRRPRVEQLGDISHITARGNDRRPIVEDDIDRAIFMRMLARVARKHRLTLFAYCLMTNHFHLVGRADDDGLSGAMRELNGGFARQMNLRHGRSDHVFGKRFASFATESDSHLLETCRYAVLNPVRAGLVEKPADWRWSSYRASAGLEHAPSFLALGELLGLFDPHPLRAQKRYRAFVAEGRAAESRVPVTVTVTAV